jgi:hypothetical protein
MCPTCKLIAVLCCAGLLASAENIRITSRILAFDSQVVVRKNRDLEVRERIEIANDDGFFDTRLHRYLSVKRANQQRPNPGSIESIRAKADGRDAQVTTEQADSFHIGIPAESPSWSRGNHIVELDYTARNRFSVYDSFEDLNENITGAWSVPIEKAVVELNFPSGVPPRLSISADSGSDSSIQFDCVRTELPLGIRFETTHPIPPKPFGARLSSGNSSICTSPHIRTDDHDVARRRTDGGFRLIARIRPFLPADDPVVRFGACSIGIALVGYVRQMVETVSHSEVELVIGDRPACFHGPCVRTLRFLDDHDGQVCRAGESRDEFPDDGSRR